MIVTNRRLAATHAAPEPAIDRGLHQGGARQGGAASGREPSIESGTHEAANPALQPADPRLLHPAARGASGLIALQRSAGNAAVAALVGGPIAVQRAPVEIDELTVRATVGEPAGGTPGVPGPSPGAGADAGNAITTDGSNVTITGANVTLAAPLTQTDGVIRAGTIIADSVVASSYTPGAGNEW